MNKEQRSFPISHPKRGNWKRDQDRNGNGLVKTTIPNGKSGTVWETEFQLVVETSGAKTVVSFPNPATTAKMDAPGARQARSGGNVEARTMLL